MYIYIYINTKYTTNPKYTKYALWKLYIQPNKSVFFCCFSFSDFNLFIESLGCFQSLEVLEVLEDGSCFESGIHELARCGWGFVCLCANGVVVAVAYGTCPPWIEDIGGAEAWGSLQAALIAAPGSTFWTDCRPLLTMVRKGQSIGDELKQKTCQSTLNPDGPAGRHAS